MFTSSVDRFYGFMFEVMQNHNELHCQTQGPGMARMSYWVEIREDAVKKAYANDI